MGSASDIEELLPKAMAQLRDAKRGNVWKPLLAAVITFAGAAGGGTFAAGRYFEHAIARFDEHEDRIKKLEEQRERDRSHLDETWTVAIDGKKVAEMQCHRIDAKWGERICP